MTWQPSTYGEGLRMAWDEDDDGVDHCLRHIEPYLPLEPGAWIVDIGAGVGRLTIPLARKYPKSNFVGLDTSRHMLNQAEAAAADLPNVVWTTRWTTDQCHGAYSVVTFQHLSDDAVRSYLTAVGQAGASIVFQFVEGDERESLSMQHRTGDVIGWVREAGFKKSKVWNDDRFPNWRWVYAR